MLTTRREEFARHICQHNELHGVSPSLRELADHFGYRTPATAQLNVNWLIEQGYFERLADRWVVPTEKWERYCNHKTNQWCNPHINEVVEERPELFDEFSDDDWRRLRSSRGMGGELTPEGIIDYAARINEDRELRQSFNELLLIEVARADLMRSVARNRERFLVVPM